LIPRPLKEKSLENRNSLTQRRRGAKVANQKREFLLSDLCGLAALREGFSFSRLFSKAERAKKNKRDTGKDVGPAKCDKRSRKAAGLEV
jgi:hypothetical protein